MAPATTPTWTPVPATLTPPPPPGYSSLRNAQHLEQTNSVAARIIRALPWVADGVSPAEQQAAESLIYFATTEQTLFWDLTEKPWLAADSSRQLSPVLNGLDNILSLDPAAVEKIVSMPFLDALEAPDLAAMESLARLAYTDLSAFRGIMAHPNINDGITDEEAKVVALLWGVNLKNPGLVNTLLDFSRITLEQRTIDLPLAGQVTLAIVRTRPGAGRSMDLLEHSVRATEDFIGEPFPKQYVALLFEDAVPSSYTGTNFGTHLVILPKHDVNDDSHESTAAGHIIAHEVAHYYWSGADNWLDEGAAEFNAAYSERIRVGRPLIPDNYPCAATASIVELESRNYLRDSSGFRCNYAHGERLFLDLYRSLGDALFRQGYRRLYLATGIDGGDSSRSKASIYEVRAAFKSNTTDTTTNTNTTNGAAAEASNAAVDRVIARWYDGAESYDTGSLDNSPVIAQLPSVNGWIDRAYVALTEQGRPVTGFSTSEAGDWVWLTLDYSYDFSGSLQQLDFEVVEYFEDGFPYRRDTFTVEAESSYIGGTQWLSVGPGPEQDWAPGRHWVYVYHEGRKVAEVEFEVTP